MSAAVHGQRPFSISSGPFLDVLRRLRMTRPDRMPRATLLVAIAWLPLVIGGIIEVMLGHAPSALLYDLSVHARLLIAIPLLVQANHLLDQRCESAVSQLYRGDFADKAQLDRIVDRAERLRSSRLVELGIAAVVVLGGQAVAWGLVAKTGLFWGATSAGGVSFTRVWYAMVALPIAQFLYFDWLWQWAIWSYLVIRVSRLHLATIATHPDNAAGLGFLDEPLSAFGGFVLACSTMMAGAWATQVVESHVSPQTFLPHFLLFLVTVGVIACVPLCFYIPKLYRTRHRDGRKYNELALDYVRGFHRKWVDGHHRDQTLQGNPDVRSLNDMIAAVDHVKHCRLVPFSARSIFEIWVAAALPMIPLATAVVPLNELIKKLADALLAGLPV